MQAQVSSMQGMGRDERGAALVTVLLFMTLTFILITSMLAVTGNEIVISGLQRDGVRALDLAQAGVQEAIKRIEEGRPYVQGFTSSLSSAATVTVTRRYVGTNSAYQEIQSTATVGRATRRLSYLVLQQMITFPPNITFAASVIEQGSATITCGDAYARTFIQYKDYPSNSCSEPNTLTYAGWRVSKVNPDGVAACYSNADCIASNPGNSNVAKWYPAQRRTENETSTLGADVNAQTKKCPAGGGGTLPGDTVTGILASDKCNPSCTTVTVNAYGFDTDDPDGAGAVPPQAVTAALPCGLPYKITHQIFPDESGNNVDRLIKTIVFEQWFADYWRFDESKMDYVKRNGSTCVAGDQYCLPGNVEANLSSYPQLGAVPPFPDFSSVDQNYDRLVSGGGTITSGDFGCKWPDMSGDPNCSIAPANSDRPIAVLLDNGDYTINANLKGHGTIVVDGNLTVNGNFEYWGTIVVKGTLTLGAGSAVIHGGLVADNTLRISGNIQVEGGGTVTNVPVGRSIVIGKGWWER